LPTDVSGGFGFIGSDAATSHDGSSRKQVSTAATFYAGNHEVKAGADYMDGRTRSTWFYTGQQRVSIYNENGQDYYVHEFLGTNPDDPVVVPVQPRRRVLDYGGYLQDSWRAAPNLTVNVGLRWDGEQTHAVSGETVLRFSGGWQPRVGVVWDPWRNRSNEVYAFAGRFSYALPTSAVAIYFGAFPGAVTTYNFASQPRSRPQCTLPPRRRAPEHLRGRRRCRREGLIPGRGDGGRRAALRTHPHARPEGDISQSRQRVRGPLRLPELAMRSDQSGF
jgi:hypothetical protein